MNSILKIKLIVSKYFKNNNLNQNKIVNQKGRNSKIKLSKDGVTVLLHMGTGKLFTTTAAGRKSLC